MEAFAPLSLDLFAEANGGLDEDQSNFFSLSQFDMELQQQAQAALQQESWQDFDKYLAVDNQLFNAATNTARNQEAQPIFVNNDTMPGNNFNDQSTMLYEPLANLLPPSQGQSKALFDPNWNNNSNSENNNMNFKNEYASPESLPYSPPHNPQPNPSLSSTNGQPDIALFQPTVEDKTTMNSAQTPTSILDSTNWNSPSIAPPFDSAQAKVPIQRLKTNSIINNAVNAALNTSTPPVGRQHKKTAHNAIERRYRNNINDRIAELKNAVPALLYAKVKDNRTGKRAHRDDEDDEGEDGEEFLDGVAVATKLNKATILRKATEYINHLKKTGEDIRRENQTLQHILSQLPGGQDVLQQYHMQKQQQEKETREQQLLERQMQKQKEHQRKLANRKRARHNNSSHENSDEYESSSSSPGSFDPVTPPAMTNRVFMALFMCITFFSTSPLTTGPTSEKYQGHHHISRTAPITDNSQPTQSLNHASSASGSFFSLFESSDIWSIIRTVIFVVCITQLALPYLKSMFIGSSLKLKRVQKFKRTTSVRKEILNSTVTPGDLKCRQVYSLLEKSIKNQDDDDLPSNSFSLFFSLLREAVRIFSRHVLGYEIMYGDQDDVLPEEEWAKVCRWIKLNETRCVGGSSHKSRMFSVYSCLRMINLVDVLEDDIHDDINQIHARAYATAAMQMLLAVPRLSIAEKLFSYFWQHAVNSSKHSHHQDDGVLEESNLWMQSLAWTDSEQKYDLTEEIRLSRAWSEAIEILQNQNSIRGDSGHPSNQPILSLSYTAPVTVPVAILSTLHLLDHLCTQFDRLISSFTLRSESRNLNSNSRIETAFVDIMLLAGPTSAESDDNTNQQRLAHWLSTVGAIAEALWKNDLEQVEKWLPSLMQRVPRSMTCKAATVSQKATLNQLDELTKKTMIHVLVGAALLKNTDVEKQKQGLVELENAEALRSVTRKLQNKLRSANIGYEDEEASLECTAMAFAEFVVSFVSLESWINAMTLDISPEKEILIDEEIREATLNLRRMIRFPCLQTLSQNQFIIDRLSRLGRFIAQNSGDADSACDLSDSEDLNHLLTEEKMNNRQLCIKKADKAHSILHGLA
ncbi:hypothetical protein EDC96DRAFT_499115 [Choanephora cucurbitarum]|nr:hypothetical protein EDC96DRAFT_499115 [Choanephora cucurbitarum]